MHLHTSAPLSETDHQKNCQCSMLSFVQSLGSRRDLACRYVARGQEENLMAAFLTVFLQVLTASASGEDGFISLLFAGLYNTSLFEGHAATNDSAPLESRVAVGHLQLKLSTFSLRKPKYHNPAVAESSRSGFCDSPSEPKVAFCACWCQNEQILDIYLCYARAMFWTCNGDGA